MIVYVTAHLTAPFVHAGSALPWWKRQGVLRSDLFKTSHGAGSHIHAALSQIHATSACLLEGKGCSEASNVSCGRWCRQGRWTRSLRRVHATASGRAWPAIPHRRRRACSGCGLSQGPPLSSRHQPLLPAPVNPMQAGLARVSPPPPPPRGSMFLIGKRILASRHAISGGKPQACPLQCEATASWTMTLKPHDSRVT